MSITEQMKHLVEESASLEATAKWVQNTLNQLKALQSTIPYHWDTELVTHAVKFRRLELEAALNRLEQMADRIEDLEAKRREDKRREAEDEDEDE